MSEKPLNHEHGHDKHELTDAEGKEIAAKLVEKAQESKQEHAQKIAETLEQIRAEAKQEAKAADEVINQHIEKEESKAPLLVNKDLKAIKYKRTLQSVQKDLSKPERVLSKIMHNPAVDTASEALGKTVARPSGMLTGAIFAFVGSSAFLWISKHYGYTYNFLLFVLFFAGGFAVGLLVEAGLRLGSRKS